MATENIGAETAFVVLSLLTIINNTSTATITEVTPGPSTTRPLTREDIPAMVKAVVDELKPTMDGTETPGKPPSNFIATRSVGDAKNCSFNNENVSGCMATGDILHFALEHK